VKLLPSLTEFLTFSYRNKFFFVVANMNNIFFFTITNLSFSVLT